MTGEMSSEAERIIAELSGDWTAQQAVEIASYVLGYLEGWRDAEEAAEDEDDD